MEERTPPTRSKSARALDVSPQSSGRSMPPSRSSTLGDMSFATPAGRTQSASPKSPERRGQAGQVRRTASDRPKAAAIQEVPEGSESARERRTRTPSPAPAQPPPAAARAPRPTQPNGFECGLEQPAFKAMLDWWESAAQVLGVSAGTVSQSDVEETMARASGAGFARASGAGMERGSQAEPRRREAREGREEGREGQEGRDEAREAREAARRGTPPENGGVSGKIRERRNSSVYGGNENDKEKEKDNSNMDNDGGIPGLDFIYRLMAPRSLMEKYERLEREVESTVFKTYSEEEQAETRQLLHETQAAIEQRENRMNMLASSVGGLHGCYVGMMAAMLCVFVPQKCPPTDVNPLPHTCNMYENTHDLSLFNQGVLAVNALTLCMMLLTELSVFRREAWLDSTLSYNPRKPASYLSMPGNDGGPSVLQQHPYIAHQLLWQNLTAGNLARATIALVLVNLLLSSVLIIGFYNDGARSTIMIITNTLLMGAKLLWAAVICLQSKNNQQGVSLYKTMRINFNIVDANFLQSEEYERCKDKYTWEHVLDEYARVKDAEKGDIKIMAAQAKQVLKHIAVGRQTTMIRGPARDGDEPESEPGSPAGNATPGGASVRSGMWGLRKPDAAKAASAEENT